MYSKEKFSTRSRLFGRLVLTTGLALLLALSATAQTGIAVPSMSSGTTGCTGDFIAANSLIGTTADDEVGLGVFVLNNGNYVVSSTRWDNAGVVNAGAITFCNGAIGCPGTIVSPANSLVGSTASDGIGGNANLTRLSNGNFVLRSSIWDNAGVSNAGAVTWCGGSPPGPLLRAGFGILQTKPPRPNLIVSEQV